MEFHPRDRGLFEYVLETMTAQRRTRIRELAETGERTVVRQTLVLLAQEYEPRHRQKQEEQRAQRMNAAHALLETSPDDPQHPATPSARSERLRRARQKVGGRSQSAPPLTACIHARVARSAFGVR